MLQNFIRSDFLALLIVYGCKKNTSINIDQNKYPSLTIKEAQTFFENQVLPNSIQTVKAQARVAGKLSIKDLSKENDVLFKKPVWSQAYEKFVDNGKAIAVPICFDVKSYLVTGDNKGINFSDLNYLLITKKENGGMTAEWVTMYPDQEWINGNRATYTGRIIVADWDGNIKAGYLYAKNGTITQNMWESKVDQTQELAASAWTIFQKDQNFEGRLNTYGDIYQAIDGNCYIDIREIQSSDGLGVTLIRKRVQCPHETPATPTGSDGSTPTSGGANPNNPGQSGSGGGQNYPPPNCNPDPNYVPPTAPLPPGQAYIQPCPSTIPVVPIMVPPNPATITNNVTNPCLHTMIDNIVANGMNSVLLGKMIQNIFGGNTQPALRFEDSSVLPGGLPNDIAARTDGSFHTTGFGGGLISATVYVNTDLLKNSSQEYIAATVIHEVMHAFFDNISISTNSHEAMATNYFNFMTGSLKELFPSIAQADAEALTWGGLEKTLGYSTNVVDNSLKSTYSSINNQYKNKDLGVGCN